MGTLSEVELQTLINHHIDLTCISPIFQLPTILLGIRQNLI